MISATKSNNRRILVIDDQESIHDDFQKILAGENGNHPDRQAACPGGSVPHLEKAVRPD